MESRVLMVMCTIKRITAEFYRRHKDLVQFIGLIGVIVLSVATLLTWLISHDQYIVNQEQQLTQQVRQQFGTGLFVRTNPGNDSVVIVAGDTDTVNVCTVVRQYPDLNIDYVRNLSTDQITMCNEVPTDN